MTKNELVLRIAASVGYAGTLLWRLNGGGFFSWLLLVVITALLMMDFIWYFRRAFPPKMQNWSVTLVHQDEPLTQVVEVRARTAREAVRHALVEEREPHERFRWTGTAKRWRTAEEIADDEHADYILKQVEERAKTEKISLWKSARITLDILAKEAGRVVPAYQRWFSVMLICFAVTIRKLREGDKSHDAQH